MTNHNHPTLTEALATVRDLHKWGSILEATFEAVTARWAALDPADRIALNEKHPGLVRALLDIEALVVNGNGGLVALIDEMVGATE